MLGFKKVVKVNFKPFEIQQLVAHVKQVRIIKVPVKSKLSICFEFVTPQRNLLLAYQSNLNDTKKKSSQVNKIIHQNC